MKRTIKVFIIMFTLFILSACNNNSNSNDADRLELYILRNVKGTQNFIIDENPIFTGEDILSYEWSTHTITFKDEFIASRQINDTKEDIMMGGSKILGVYYPDQFALYLDGVELYRGCLKPPIYSSFLPMCPTISDSDNGIIIKCPDKKVDTRYNDKIREILKNNGLLR